MNPLEAISISSAKLRPSKSSPNLQKQESFSTLGHYDPESQVQYEPYLSFNPQMQRDQSHEKDHGKREGRCSRYLALGRKTFRVAILLSVLSVLVFSIFTTVYRNRVEFPRPNIPLLFRSDRFSESQATDSHPPYLEKDTIFDPFPSTASATPSQLVSTSEFLNSLSKCPVPPSDLNSFKSGRDRINPRSQSSQPDYLIQNATVWNGEGNVFEGHDVLIKNGLIWEVGKDLKAVYDGRRKGNLETINVMGRIVTPGIIDMHSHAGVDSYPSLRATADTNEYGDPTIPQMQSIDSFNPHDPAIPLILSGGITTMLTLPGSANLMGGEAFSFKLRKPSSNSVEEMLLNYNLTKENESSVGGKKWRWMKMACGENPKGYGRNENVMPFTRMGNAYVIRKKFSEAHQLMKAQDEWCAFGHEVYRRMTGYEYTESKRKDRKPKRPLPKFVRVMLGQYPENVSLSSTVALLRGEIKLNFHCYETFDMETMLRVTREYGVEVAAFHHALDVYRIPELIKKYSPNTTMAIFSDHWGYKKEAFQASVYAPKILQDNGISFTFKSDHPVIHAQYLAYEAGKSIHFGLTEQDVLKAITSVPAKAMGVDYRIGSIKPGMDGDIVVWSSSPFEIGSMPLKVFVDGVPSFSRDSWPENHHTSVGESPVVPEMSVDGIQQCEDESINDVLIKGVGKLFAGRGKVVEDVQIHIEGGIVKCISARCEIGSGSSPVTFDLHGGNLYPSFVSAGTRIGLFEISQESSTHDGIASTDEYVRASDGLLLGHKHQKLSANFGVNTAISSPMVKSKNGIAAGISVAFRMNATDLNDAIIKDAVALHVVIGNVVKQTDSVMGSVSGQIGELRKRLLKGFQANDNDYFYLVVNGSLPLVIETNMADHIMSIIRLKREIESLRPNPLLPPMKWIIAGASEAHLVAPYLAETGISVIIRPARCIPSDWQTRRCLTPPQSPSHLATVLKKHNVPFAVTTDEREISYVRMLPWEANWVRHLTEPKLSEVETAELASFRVSEMFNLVDQGVGVVEVGKRVNVVGVNGSILEMGGGREVQLIVEGKRVTCWPKQD